MQRSCGADTFILGGGFLCITRSAPVPYIPYLFLRNSCRQAPYCRYLVSRLARRNCGGTLFRCPILLFPLYLILIRSKQHFKSTPSSSLTEINQANVKVLHDYTKPTDQADIPYRDPNLPNATRAGMQLHII